VGWGWGYVGELVGIGYGRWFAVFPFELVVRI
jgi:hypothetical protein